jgi:hypothetical protein
MRDGKARSQSSTMAAIEAEEIGCYPVSECARQDTHHVIGRRSRSQALTFDAEICHFVEGIDGAQARIELEAIDDLGRVSKPDMFRPQVAMAIDDSPLGDAPDERFAPFAQEAALRPVDAENDA